MFTKFGIQVPFTEFQQRLLNRACVAPSQLHPNAWSSIRCFELVAEFLQLPQEPEVFLCLFKFYSSNTSGRTKKGYMSVRPTSKRKIFGLFENSFHDFKGRYFKIVLVETHRPFWLSLEGDGQFLSYWTDKAGFDVAPVTYKGLRADQKDTVDILTHLFPDKNLAPISLLRKPEEAREDIGPSSTARADTPPVGPTPEIQITPERGSSNEGGRNPELLLEVSCQDRNIEQHLPPLSPNKRAAPEDSVATKRQRTEGPSREFSAMDRSFDASGFIAANQLGPKAQEALRDYDPVESVCWAQWALLSDKRRLRRRKQD
ncbi:hypothetical protein PIB30_077808 [Stylosanthes scabra]|uniref:Uncharacterized protein n=1 Tax=Stylosanthes scabra TaxID=79078 RepID=A0ABU6YSG9_9FABA|nr:hypothetical protein [Stylosanthes scabra]